MNSRLIVRLGTFGFLAEQLPLFVSYLTLCSLKDMVNSNGAKPKKEGVVNRCDHKREHLCHDLGKSAEPKFGLRQSLGPLL